MTSLNCLLNTLATVLRSIRAQCSIALCISFLYQQQLMCVVFILILNILYAATTRHSLQFDALWDHVSPSEHLRFCARCRGYAEVRST